MEPFIQSIHPDLSELSAQRVLSGTLPDVAYELGGISFSVPKGISYNLTFTNTGEAILLQGNISAQVITDCSRCLESAQFELKSEVIAYYLLHGAQDVEDMQEDEYELIDKDGAFDISHAIEAALSDATPFVVLCKPDCKGLCSKCGANLNEQQCNCDEAIDPDNPFAALADMKFD